MDAHRLQQVAEVAGKARSMASAFHEGIDRVSHLPGPVLVVAGEDGAVVIADEIRRKVIRDPVEVIVRNFSTTDHLYDGEFP